MRWGAADGDEEALDQPILVFSAFPRGYTKLQQTRGFVNKSSGSRRRAFDHIAIKCPTAR